MFRFNGLSTARVIESRVSRRNRVLVISPRSYKYTSEEISVNFSCFVKLFVLYAINTMKVSGETRGRAKT